jgi:hypothetical protein
VSYTIRNTIILGIVLLLIVGAGGFYTMYRMPRSMQKVDAEIKRLNDELQNTPDLANQYNTTAALLEDVKVRWETRHKEVPAKDITGETYGYFNRTMDLSGEVKMDMTYVGPKDFGNYGYNVYTLKGEATYQNLYKFIWYSESGRRLFKLTNLTLRGYEAKNAETKTTKVLVLFEMELQAFYSSMAELNNAPAPKVGTPATLASNPFYPLIMREIPPPQPDEVEIERSDLKAVIPGKAFIIDQNQKSRVLEEGAPVYLGYVTRIVPDDGLIECLLNKGGVAEKFVLKIRQGQPIK